MVVDPIPLDRTRRPRRWFRPRVLSGVIAGVVLVASLTPLGRFGLRAGWEEGRILWRRRAIPTVLSDAGLPPALRAKLRLVEEARAFAEGALALPSQGAFRSYADIGRDTLVLVLSAAERDRLVPLTWWFPVVGRVPYRGYFDWEEARQAELALRQQGYDTYLRPAPAFSTLGWFEDPVLNTTLAGDSAAIVTTVIHELTHARYFAPDAVPFNESFANFVGARGAERFFAARGDSVNAARVAARWADQRVLAALWRQVADSMDAIVAAHPGEGSRARRLALRDSLYAATRRTLRDSIAPRLRTVDRHLLARVPLDNAALLARRIYLTDVEPLESILTASGGDLARAIDRIIAARM